MCRLILVYHSTARPWPVRSELGNQVRYYTFGTNHLNTSVNYRMLVTQGDTLDFTGLDLQATEKFVKEAACGFLTALRSGHELLGDFNIFTDQARFALDLNHVPDELLPSQGDDFDEQCDALREIAAAQAITVIRSLGQEIKGYLSVMPVTTWINDIEADAYVISLDTYNPVEAWGEINAETAMATRHQIIIPHDKGCILQEDLKLLIDNEESWDEQALSASFNDHEVTGISPANDWYFTKSSLLASLLTQQQAKSKLAMLKRHNKLAIDTSVFLAFDNSARNRIVPFRSFGVGKRQSDNKGFGK